ncbi:glycosyltransferase [Congregibacter sp.]|uniref:glycosyltransferase n=1 Tax=Congregibacter sp. TaxID=2744308 RepID=UPI003F6BA5A0
MKLPATRFASELKKAGRLLNQGQFLTLFEKSVRRAARAPWKKLSASQLLDQLQASGPVALFIDSYLGGGSTDYLDREVVIAQDRGVTVIRLALHGLHGGLVVTSDALKLNHQVTGSVHLLLGDERLAGSIKSLQVGTLVGFAEPVQLINSLRLLISKTSAPTTVTWHDHYLICPSHLLLDASGDYCAVPGLEACKRCISAHSVPVDVSVREGGLSVWRQACQELLEVVDEIRVFSRSSMALIRQAYGTRFDHRMTLVPHDMAYFRMSAPPARRQDLSIIAVIGRISFHKGAEVVSALAAEIRARDLSIKIRIVGTSEVRFDSRVVSVSGGYKASELPELLDDLAVSLVLMPSIWPETFSYVAHEVMAMKLPLVTLPLGAQAECAESYSRGFVASSMHAPTLLDEMLGFARSGYGECSV